MRIVVTLLLLAALIYSALWTWQAYTQGAYHAPGLENANFGGMTLGYGRALCAALGC